MQNPIVSIVIPVYKTEEFLEKCVESVLNQSYANLEIILVDDESPDKSPEICDRLSREHANISVIHKKKSGSWNGTQFWNGKSKRQVYSISGFR